MLFINNSTTNKILTSVHIVMQNGGKNGDIHISLKHGIQTSKVS